MKNIVFGLLISIAMSASNASAAVLEPCSAEECVSYFKKFKRAARRGFISAEFNLAKFYYYGYGTDVDHEKALKYYRKSAVQGSREAQYMTGLLYITNKELNDYDQGTYWLQRASLNAHKHAEFLLGKAYAINTEGKANYAESDKWLSKAFERDYHKLPELIEELSANNVFNEANYPTLYNKLVEKNMWVVDGKVTNWTPKNIEQITITGSTLESGLDNLLASFRGRNASTGSRLKGDCTMTGGCKRKSLNEMKDSMWVSQK